MTDAEQALADEHELDRQEYNCAVANGLIIKARSINRRMLAREWANPVVDVIISKRHAVTGVTCSAN